MSRIRLYALALLLIPTAGMVFAQQSEQSEPPGFVGVAAAIQPNFAAADKPTWATFRPVYQTDVVILDGWRKNLDNTPKRIPINPLYALSETSALELMAVLEEFKPVLFFSGPFGWKDSGGYAASRTVPWIMFPDGSCINAGLMASYWTHGFSVSWLEQSVRADIAWMHLLAERGGIEFSRIQGKPGT